MLTSRGRLAGFLFARVHGSEGWFGPLAIHPRYQGNGFGKLLIEHAIAYMKDRGCTCIGLETMPRTYNNLGLYTRMGFQPGALVMTCQVPIPATVPTVPGAHPAFLMSQLTEPEQETLRTEIMALWNRVAPGLDYTGSIESGYRHDFGDVLLTRDDDQVTGCLQFHHSRYFVTDGAGVLRIARITAVRDSNAFARLISGLATYGLDHSMNELYIRCQASDWQTTKQLIDWGFRIAHTDLRMHLETHPEQISDDMIHFTRWG